MQCQTLRPPGRLTLPRTPLTDRAFVYVSSAATDITQSITRERQRLRHEALLAELQRSQQQPLLPGIDTANPPLPIRRLRAGIGTHLTLPTL